jgi:RNA polymerase sigma factor (sigma-70 family)
MATTSLDPLARYLRTVCPESDAAVLAHFARTGDEEAFAELVRRHGPAVLGVCRRIVRDPHAAEDAFQATFLLLAKKAGSLGRPERLGCWLHGVARRTALKLRTRLLRRMTRERPFDESTIVSTDADADLGPALDAAIEQLPLKYRLPVVLCYLQGLTNAEAAAAMGCPANTVATRLARARHRLRGRLVKQGLTVAVSSGLVAATARNAAALASGSSLSPDILTLMEGVRSAMLWKKTKLVVVTVALLALSGLGAAQWGFRATAQQPGTGDIAPRPSEPAPVAVPPTTEIPDYTKSRDRIPPVDLVNPEPKSKNFIVTGATPEVGYEIAQAAEKLRGELAKQWLGKELPDWKERCPIQVRINDHVPGSASTVFDFGSDTTTKNSDGGVNGITWRTFRISGMQLSGSKAGILLYSLPHEVTHTILADHFRQPVPRWADEGAAILAESPESQRRHDKQCRDLLATGRALRLSVLFRMKDYPSDTMVTFAQGYSIARFLVERKDRSAFVAFIAEGLSAGWDAAAKAVYDYRSVDELEEAWIASLRQRPVPTPPASPPRSPSAPSIDPIPARDVWVQLNVMVLNGPTKMLDGEAVKASMPKLAGNDHRPVDFGVLRNANAERLAIACREKAGAKVLTEPRMVTVSGQAARVNVGGEQAVLGPNGITYRPVGLELQLLPIAKVDGRTYLEVSPTLRAVNTAAGSTTTYGFVPAFDERSVRLAAELRSGETALIRLHGWPQEANQGPDDQTTMILITPQVLEKPPGPAPTRPPAVDDGPAPPIQPVDPPFVTEPPRPAKAAPPLDVIPPPIMPAPTVAAPVAEAPTTGTGLVVVQASFDKDGMVVCQFAKRSTYHPVTNIQPGTNVPVTSYVRQTTQEERVFNQSQLRIVGTDGKPIDAKVLTARLAKETPAIFIHDGGYDPKLLSLLKEGTLIISPATKVSPNVPPPVR